MGLHSGYRAGFGFVLLSCGFAGSHALAEERLVRTQVSVLASQRHSLDPAPGFMPWAHVGLSLRLRDEAEAGWHFGADASWNLGRTDTSHLGLATFGLQDSGSSLFARYRPEGWAPGEAVSLKVYPLDSSRLRLGWAYPATWGGNFYGRWEANTTEREWTPGVVLQLQQERWHAFAALKTSSLTESLAPMVGAGVSLPLSLRAEVQAAHIQRHEGGSYPPLLEPDTYQHDHGQELGGGGGATMPYAQGVSARLVHEQGGPIGDPVDFRLYGSAPTLFDDVLRPESYSEGFAHSVSLEATHAIMSTIWWGSGFRRTHTNVLALDARMRWNRLRVHALGLVRGAGAVVLDDGHLWGDFARGSKRLPELGMGLGADYHLASVGLTPGLGVRVLRPAAHLRNEGFTNPGTSWWVVSSEGIAKVGPEGSEPQPRVSARASLKWNLLSWVSAVGELSYTWNQDTLSTEGDPFFFYRRGPERVVDSAGLDFNLLVQARY